MIGGKMKLYHAFIMIVILGLTFDIGYRVALLTQSAPTPVDIAVIADSVAQAKIDSLFPIWVHGTRDWSVICRQVQFHAFLHRRFYNGRSKWHRYVRRELDEARDYWQPKNQEE